MSRYWNAFNASQGAVEGTVNAFRQGEKESALRAYAANPSAPGAMGSLAQYDPALAIRMQGQQSEQAADAKKAKEDRDTKVFGGMVQSIDPSDPQASAKFDQAIDQMVQLGYGDAAQLKGRFSPAVRSAMMAAAGLKDDTPQPTAFQREAEYFGVPRAEAAELWKTKQGTINVNGVPHVYRPAPAEAVSGPPPEAIEELR